MKPEYKDRKYSIIAYDASWPEKFTAEAEQIKAVFGNDAVSIEHIGSTAVPEMAGKPTIDILILVKDIDFADKYKQQMSAIDYLDRGDYLMQNARLFSKEKGNVVFVNVHVFQADHPHVKEMLSMRDYLKTHPKIVKEYSDLKVKLYDQFKNDYGQYRKFKDAYIEDLKKKI